MLTFLAPLALAASALLAIPVIIHLLKPKRVRTMPFSSLRWLRASQHKLSRRIQWHQVLLFLLRAAFLLLLVLALAKPILARTSRRQLTERFIILDVSRSMNYEQPGGETPFVRGRKIARSLLESGLPGDRATILLTGRETVALGPLVEDPTRYVARLEAAHAGLSETDLSSTLGVIRPMLAVPRARAVAELIYITDHYQGAWSQGAIAEFTGEVKMPATVRIIDVGPPAPRNAWIANTRLIQEGDKQVMRVRLGASGHEAQERTLHVKGAGDLTRKITLTPDTFTEVNLPLPAPLDQTQIAELTLEPRDALPDDDLSWLNLSATAGLQVLLLEPESTQIESLQAGFPLRMALQALSRGEAGAIEVTRRTPEAVVASDFTKADLVVMANVPQLTDDRLLALEGRVRAGAGLLLFLGPAVQPGFYNTKLHHPQSPVDGLLPRPLGEIASYKLANLNRIAWTHPLLAPLFDPTLGDFAQVRARQFFRFGAAPAGDRSEALAWFNDVAPALLEHQFGAGRVLIFNTTANDEWSDLSRRNSFVPLLDQALQRLPTARQSRFVAGEPVIIPIALPYVQARLVSPSKRELSPVLELLNTQINIRLESTTEIGAYSGWLSAEGLDATLSFIIEAGRGDSIVAKADTDLLRAWWGKVPIEVTHPDSAAPPSQAAGTARVLLWPWLFVLGALVLLAEMYFVHRLCPVMNPAAVHSTVARQGILAPTAKPEGSA